MQRLLTNVPTLAYNQQFDRWALRLNRCGMPEDGYSYEMLICCAFQSKEEGWFSYRFIRWEMGDWVEVGTQATYDEWINNMRAHEGEEIAELWASEQDQIEVLSDNHPVFKLRQHWEAMMTLELFFPSVTNRGWEGKPVNDDLNTKLAALRDAALREQGVGF